MICNETIVLCSLQMIGLLCRLILMNFIDSMREKGEEVSVFHSL